MARGGGKILSEKFFESVFHLLLSQRKPEREILASIFLNGSGSEIQIHGNESGHVLQESPGQSWLQCSFWQSCWGSEQRLLKTQLIEAGEFKRNGQEGARAYL